MALKYFFGRTKVGSVYSDKAPEIVSACKSIGIIHERSQPGMPQNSSVIERTNLDILDGARTALICAGFPECFWPFAAPHYCLLENTSPTGSDGKLFPDGSRCHRAHGEGETEALRLPFGCEVIFLPSSTKGHTHGRWEGTGEVGVIAGYCMDPGYRWGGRVRVLVIA